MATSLSTTVGARQHAEAINASGAAHSFATKPRNAVGVQAGSSDSIARPTAAADKKTYSAPRARGKNDDDRWQFAKRCMKAATLVTVGVATVVISLALLAEYLVMKRAVHRGIIQAARDGVIGNQQNRLNAASV